MAATDFTDNTTVIASSWLDDVDQVVYEQHGVGKTTVASATTPDIFAATVGNFIDYTGTTTCTGFAAAVSAGSHRVLYCAGAAVFTAGANLLIDGVASGSNLTCAAGDILDVVANTTTQFKITKRTLGNGYPGILRGNATTGTTTTSAVVGVASTSGTGVYGSSSSGNGVHGASTSGYGAAGTSTDTHGVYGSSASGYGVYGYSTGNHGVYGQSDNNYGVVAHGDVSSPIKASFRIVPQDAQPSGANLVGDIYVTSAGVLKICTVAGTPGTWVSVGTQT